MLTNLGTSSNDCCGHIRMKVGLVRKRTVARKGGSCGMDRINLVTVLGCGSFGIRTSALGGRCTLISLRSSGGGV